MHIFGTPYVIAKISADDICTLMAYESDAFAQDMAAQAILGGFPVNGKLPVSVGTKYEAGTGKDISMVRGYWPIRMPEYVGMNGELSFNRKLTVWSKI